MEFNIQYVTVFKIVSTKKGPNGFSEGIHNWPAFARNGHANKVRGCQGVKVPGI